MSDTMFNPDGMREEQGSDDLRNFTLVPHTQDVPELIQLEIPRRENYPVTAVFKHQPLGLILAKADALLTEQSTVGLSDIRFITDFVCYHNGDNSPVLKGVTPNPSGFKVHVIGDSGLSGKNPIDLSTYHKGPQIVLDESESFTRVTDIPNALNSLGSALEFDVLLVIDPLNASNKFQLYYRHRSDESTGDQAA